jgi:hypothetical protein
MTEEWISGSGGHPEVTEAEVRQMAYSTVEAARLELEPEILRAHGLADQANRLADRAFHLAVASLFFNVALVIVNLIAWLT